jgi:hypothetical protein
MEQQIKDGILLRWRKGVNTACHNFKSSATRRNSVRIRRSNLVHRQSPSELVLRSSFSPVGHFSLYQSPGQTNLWQSRRSSKRRGRLMFDPVGATLEKIEP